MTLHPLAIAASHVFAGDDIVQSFDGIGRDLDAQLEALATLDASAETRTAIWALAQACGRHFQMTHVGPGAEAWFRDAMAKCWQRWRTLFGEDHPDIRGPQHTALTPFNAPRIGGRLGRL